MLLLCNLCQILSVYLQTHILVCACVLSHFSHFQFFATLWTTAHQALLSMGFSRQGYWSGLPCPPPGDLPDPTLGHWGSHLLHWQAGSLPLALPGKPQRGIILGFNLNFPHVRVSSILPIFIGMCVPLCEAPTQLLCPFY